MKFLEFNPLTINALLSFFFVHQPLCFFSHTPYSILQLSIPIKTCSFFDVSDKAKRILVHKCPQFFVDAYGRESFLVCFPNHPQTQKHLPQEQHLRCLWSIFISSKQFLIHTPIDFPSHTFVFSGLFPCKGVPIAIPVIITELI